MDYELLSFDDLDEVQVEGLLNQPAGKSLNIYIEKCEGNGCSPSNEFIENIQVITIGMFDQIDFQLKYTYPPIVQTSQKLH